MITFVLFPDIMQGVQCSGLIELIQHDEVGIIQHVDLFQL